MGGKNIDPTRKVRSNANERPTRQHTNYAGSIPIGGFTQYWETNYVKEHVITDQRHGTDGARTMRSLLGHNYFGLIYGFLFRLLHGFFLCKSIIF